MKNIYITVLELAFYVLRFFECKIPTHFVINCAYCNKTVSFFNKTVVFCKKVAAAFCYSIYHILQYGVIMKEWTTFFVYYHAHAMSNVPYPFLFKAKMNDRSPARTQSSEWCSPWFSDAANKTFLEIFWHT